MNILFDNLIERGANKETFSINIKPYVVELPRSAVIFSSSLMKPKIASLEIKIRQ
jgi:hypothetical protein